MNTIPVRELQPGHWINDGTATPAVVVDVYPVNGRYQLVCRREDRENTFSLVLSGSTRVGLVATEGTR